MGEIKLIRLVSGEFIVARVSKTHEYGLELESPMVLIPQGNNIGFADFMMYSSSSVVSINHEHIIFVVDPQDDLETGYIRATSGLIIANDSVLH